MTQAKKAAAARKPVVCSFDIDIITLAELATVSTFASTDTSRPTLMQVLFEIEGRDAISAWATDSYRLCSVMRTLSDLRRADRTYVKPIAFMFPAKKLTEIARLTSAVKLPYVKLARGIKPEPRKVHFDIVGSKCTITDTVEDVGGTTWRVELYDDYAYPDVRALVNPELWDKINTTKAAFNPKFLTDLRKITPFNGEEFQPGGNSMVVRKLATVDSMTITSKDGRTVVMLMPVRID